MITKKLFSSVAIVVSIITSSGCSTIVNGTTQKITVKNDNCSVTDSTGNVEIKDNTAVVKRSNKGIVIRCDEDTYLHSPSLTKEAITSIMTIDFGIIDFLTGAAWGYNVE